MQIRDDYTDVPCGKVAAVVTHLEMLSRASARPVRADDHLALRRVKRPEAGWYRHHYSCIGADWLWFSRLAIPVSTLEEIIQHASVEVYALVASGCDVGLLELDFRVAHECELAFFGITPELIGSGAGRYLMNAAIACAWARPIHRFWVHTCTLDHPGALAFYRRSGFVPIRQQIEIADDPRLAGVLPMSAAPQVPIYPR